MGDATVYLRFPSLSHLVGTLNCRDTQIVQLPHYFRHARVPITATRREILIAQQPYALSRQQRHGLPVDVDIIRITPVLAHIIAVLRQIIIHRSLVIFFCLYLILFGHAEVPRYILVTNGRYQVTARYLRLIIRIDIDDFPLLCLRFVVRFKVTPGEVARLERDMLHQPGYVVGRRVEAHAAVLEVVDGERLLILAGQFLMPDISNSAGIMREDFRESRLFHIFVKSVLSVPVYIGGPVRQLQTGKTVAASVDVFCGSQRNKPGEELHIIAVFGLRQGCKPLHISQ